MVGPELNGNAVGVVGEAQLNSAEEAAHSKADSGDANLRIRYRRRRHSRNGKNSTLLVENVGQVDETDAEDKIDAFCRIRDFVLNDNRERLSHEAMAASARRSEEHCDRVAEDDSDALSCVTMGRSEFGSEGGWLASAEGSSDELYYAETIRSVSRPRRQEPTTAGPTTSQTVVSNDGSTSESGSECSESGDSAETIECDNVVQVLRDGARSECTFSDITVEEGQHDIVLQPMSGPFFSIAHFLEEPYYPAILLAREEADERLRMDFSGIILA